MLEFVKNNLNDPYIIDLFSVFIVNSKAYTSYKELKEFYTRYLKSNIEDLNIKKQVEDKINLLQQAVDIGKSLPHFTAYSLNNELISSDKLLGKNILIIFWATWCQPCIKEIPVLKEINEKYKNHNLLMISVSLDVDSIKLVTFVKEKKLNWIQIFNSKELPELFRINPIPAIFLINEAGIIVYNSINITNETENLDKLKSLLIKKFKY